MKKHILFVTGLFLALSGKAQLMLSENFTNFSGTGWTVVNNSSNPGQNWFLPTASSTFPAYNGGPNDYIACNWASTTDTSTPQDISNWLITPVVTLVNGGVLTFATRTSTNPADFADRLEVSMSTAGNGTDVGLTPNSVGTFSNVLVTINPGLNLTSYPGTWTVYTATITGLSGPVSGRFGFRYYVTNGGWGGTNSDYIGLDAVRYFNPCNLVTQDYTVCANQSLTLAATGQWTNTTYNWSPVSSSSSSIVVSPASSTTYTLDYMEAGNPCPQRLVNVTISTTLNVNVAASDQSVCPGSSVTFTASGAATSYTWVNNMSTGAIKTFTPGATTIYTVLGMTGTFPSNFCAGGNTVEVSVFPQPTVVVVPLSGPVCMGKSYTLTANGAEEYVWVLSPTSAMTGSAAVLTATTSGPVTYTVAGIDANGCFDLDQITVTEAENPTVAVTPGTGTICVNDVITFTATGATSYSYSGAATSTANPMPYSSATTGAKQFTVTGANAEGCTHSFTAALTVNACTGISALDEIKDLTVFPNPFSGELRFTGFSGSAVIYNMLGAVVTEVPVNGALVFDSSALPKGAYLVQARSATGEVLKSFNVVKQ